MSDVIFPFAGNSLGGSHVSSLVMAKSLKKYGHNVSIVTPKDGYVEIFFQNSKFEKLSKCGKSIKLDKSKYLILFAYVYSFFFSFIFLMGKQNSIIHINDDLTFNVWGVIGKILRKKIIWHVRNATPSKFDPFRAWIASEIICVSKFVARERILSLRKKYSVIYNSVEIMCKTEIIACAEKIRSDYKISSSSSSSLLLHASRKSKDKRLDWSIATYRELEEKGCDCKLLIAGNFSDQEIHFLASKYGVTKINNIINLGWVENIQPVISISDIVLHPSLGKSFGLDRIIQESISLSKCIVTVDSGANSELCLEGDKAYIVSGNTLEEFKAEVLKQQIRISQSKIDKNILEIDKRFDPEFSAREIDRVYKFL